MAVCPVFALAGAAGLDCKIVSGLLSGGSRARDRVCCGGVWYCIYPTTMDPEPENKYRYEYPLNETLWYDHTAGYEQSVSDCI